MIKGIAVKHRVKAYFPAKKVYNSDNAAMIALAGYYKALLGEYSNLKTIDRLPNWEIDKLNNN